VRYHAVVALEKAISTAKRALTDSLLRDVIKQMRSALSDKSLPIIRAATSVSLLYTYSCLFDQRLTGPCAAVPFWRQCEGVA
jgi:hypothetical protein